MEQEQREREKERLKGGGSSTSLDSSKNKGYCNLFLINSDLTRFRMVLCYKIVFLFAEVQTLDTIQALCLPLGASISLLVMFFFFDSMQMLFAICTASKCVLRCAQCSIPVNTFVINFLFSVIATVALAFLLLPMCQYIMRPCSDGTK